MQHTQDVQIRGHEQMHMVSLASLGIGAAVLVVVVLLGTGLVTKFLRRRRRGATTGQSPGSR